MPSELPAIPIHGPATIERADRLQEPSAKDAAGFGETLGRALGQVDRLQLEADQQARLVADGGGNLHEMAIALEKADVSMRLAMRVRNKLVEAYNEIMRMSV